MNYYDESQEQYEEIAVQSTDNMPVGAVIEYSGNDVPVGWEKVNDYSTNEVNTGKTWIDGKPIYRKVIEYTPSQTIGAVGQLISINIAHNISNFERPVNISGYVLAGTKYIILPSINTTSTNYNLGTNISSIDSTNIVLYILNDTWGTNRTFTFIIEYTKTTD